MRFNSAFTGLTVNTMHKGDSDDDDDDDNVYCPKHRSPAYTKHKLYHFFIVVKRNEYKQYVWIDLQTCSEETTLKMWI